MSLFYMARHAEGLPPEDCIECKTYEDGRTKQSFKQECDVGEILKKFSRTGVIAHKDKYSYGEFAEFDFTENLLKINKADEVFGALPSEVRREFNQSPAEFFQYVNDPGNKDRLNDLLPKIAARGDYLPDVSGKTPPGALIQEGSPGGSDGQNEGNAEVHSDGTGDSRE